MLTIVQLVRVSIYNMQIIYMQINAKKTKAMVVTRNEGIPAKLEHEGEYPDQVKDLKFLGSYKSADGDCTNDMKDV